MYWSNGEGTIGGHATVGIQQPEKTWYLAEGFTGAGFKTFILIQNPNSTPAIVTVTYMLDDGSVQTRSVTVPSNARYTIEVHDPGQLGLDKAFATRLDSDKPIIVERAMYFNNEGHATMGVTSPQKTWYLAEGYTGQGFQTYILLQNPNDVGTAVTLTYMLQGGGTSTVNVTVPAHARYTVISAETLGLEKAFSTKIEAAQPIIVERSMYWPNGTATLGGHVNTGAISADKTWYLAEGYTGANFGTYILIQNPNSVAAEINVTYMFQGGGMTTQTLTVAANARYTIVARDIAEVGLDKAFSTRLVSNQPIIVERAMYFPNGGHAALGVVLKP
jgi:hypothetical protein